MLKHIEHIGIAVANLEGEDNLFDRLFDRTPYKKEVVESEGVKTIFYKFGETKIELLEVTNPESPIAKYLAKRGQGVHHLAFETDDIHAEVERLKKQDFVVLGEPHRGADNKIIVFLHPKTTARVLIELCQDIKTTND